MIYEIKHRISGNVLFSLECGSLKLCLEAAVENQAYLRGANLREADLSGANLSEADLREADLSGANLRGANLREAYLSGADLSEADLREAYLREADLRGANLREAKGIVSMPVSDLQYVWFGVWFGSQWMVQARCRWFTISEAREHWIGDHYTRSQSVKDTVEFALEWLGKQEPK